MSAACPDANHILAYLDGLLSAAEVDALDVHLEDCGACRRLLGDLAQASGRTDAPPGAAARSAPAAARSGASPSLLPLQPGTVLGRYHILEWVGSGGMGVVYAAYDPELDRRVALKIVRSEWAQSGATDARARMLREARSLARLSHPNVVAAYDVGQVGEQVFMTMEYIEGDNLRLWLRKMPRTPGQVLAAFRQAGAGLAAAHRVGLVHRDFKPDNILCGQDGVVRVTDFGLARPAGTLLPAGPAAGPAEERSTGEKRTQPAEPFSRSGVILGTPTYMAPELQRGGRADSRSDQYAFCVSLYEGLYGRTPFSSAQREDGTMALLPDDELSPPPGGKTRVAAWVHDILRRGLHLDPEQRFPSMQALLEALERDPGMARRQRIRTALLLLASLVSIGGISLLLVNLHGRQCQDTAAQLGDLWNGKRRAAVREALQRAGRPGWQENWERVALALDRYTQGWVAQQRELCEATLRHEVSAALRDLRLQCLEQRRNELLALTEVLTEGDARLADQAVTASSALTDLSTCVSITTLSAPERPPADPATMTRLAELRARQARLKVLLDADRNDEGLELAQSVLLAARALGYRPLEAELLIALGRFQSRLADPQAGRTMREAVRVAESARHDQAKLDAMTQLIRILGLEEGRYDEAEQLARDAQATLFRLGGDARRGAELDGIHGRLLAEQGRFVDGERLLKASLLVKERLYGSASYEAAAGLWYLGALRLAQGRYPEAEADLRRALASLERVLGPQHRTVADLGMQLVLALIPQGRLTAAEQLARRMMAVYKAVFPRAERSTALGYNAMAATQLALGCLEEALADAQQATALTTTWLGPRHPATGKALLTLAQAQSALGHHQEARRSAQQALALFERVYAPGHPERQHAQDVLAAVQRVAPTPKGVRPHRCAGPPP